MLDKGDWNGLANIAHAIKGAAGQLGFADLAKHASALQRVMTDTPKPTLLTATHMLTMLQMLVEASAAAPATESVDAKVNEV